MINIAKFEEYCLFNTVLRKMPVIWSCAVGQNVDTLRFNCHNNSHFFQERIGYFQICYTEWPCHFKVPRSCLFSLQTFFFLHFHVSKQFIFTFQTPSFQYFSSTHPRLQKNNGPSLNHRRDWLKKWIKTIKFNSL